MAWRLHHQHFITRTTIMLPSSRFSHAPRASLFGRAAASALAVGLLLASSGSALAQTAPAKRDSWELLFSTGALVPTGAQRRVVKDAPLSTAQLSYVVRSRFAVTTMLGWAR